MRSRLVAFLVCSLLGLLALAPAASATLTASFALSTLTVNSDESGETIVVTCPVNNVLINGGNPPAPVGPLLCEGGGGTLGAIVVNGNGGNDVIDVSALYRASESKAVIGAATVDGGSGDDDLTGAYLPPAPDIATLLGGPGNDRINAEGGTPKQSVEVVHGGSGDDLIAGLVQGSGTMAGEDGTDTFAFELPGASSGLGFAPGNFALTLFVPGTTASQAYPWSSIEVVDLALTDAGETVDGRTFSGSLRVRTRGGTDTIYGTELGDVLDAGPGNDFIEGLGGADQYQGGSGFDLLHARDGVADGGDCGGDDDTLVADAIDALVGCERVDLPPAGPDKLKPKLKLKRATLAKGKLRLAIGCPRNEIRCVGLLTLAMVGKEGKSKVTVKLGTLTFRLAGGKSKTLSRAVAAKKLETLRGLDQLKLQVKLDVLDAAGNRSRGRKLVALGR